MTYTPHASDVEMPIVAYEPRKRIIGHGSWHITERRCPECGYRLACDGRASWVCNRCEYAETKDVRKYEKLAVHYQTWVKCRYGRGV